MRVRDILNLKGGAVYTIDAGDDLAASIALMVRHDVGSLVVVDAGEMVGMLTFREVLKALDAQDVIAGVRARDVMVKEPICGNPAQTVDELRELMTRHHVRYLPVKDGGRLVGVVSFHDVAKAVIRETSMENRLLKRYIEHSSGTRS